MPTIVFRADDAGSSEGANLAILKTVREGVVRNVSIMAPGLNFEHAKETLQGLPDINFGLHVTLNAEWEHVKWGPVLAKKRVPTLVDGAGFFSPSPQVLHSRGFSVSEAMEEVEAQLQRIRDAGFHVDYLDEHMGVGWIGLSDELRALCARESLVYAADVPVLAGSQTRDLQSLMECLSDAPSGPHAVIGHPGSDFDALMRQFTLGGRMPGEILRERAQDRRILTDTRLVAAVGRGEIRSIRYRESAG